MEVICSEDPYAKYNPGVYEAECVGGELYWDPRFKSHKCRLDFKLIPGGEVVSGFYHLGGGRRPQMGRGSRFMRAVAIAKGAAPRKGEMCGPELFRGKLFEVEVGDVIRTYDGKEHPPCLKYSTIKDIVRKTHP